MNLPPFYLNALTSTRLYHFEFVLCINQSVQDKDRGMVLPNTGMPARVHARFSRDIGDIVYYFVGAFRRDAEFMQHVAAVVNILRSEQSTDIPITRARLLAEADKYILARTAYPVCEAPFQLGENFRDFLLNFISEPGVLEKLAIPKDSLMASISSPAILQFRQFLDFYAERFLEHKDPKSYINFYACVCTVLSAAERWLTNACMYTLLGEVENVTFQHMKTFPGYSDLDNAAKYEKLLICYSPITS